jgi:hypothetical protein
MAKTSIQIKQDELTIEGLINCLNQLLEDLKRLNDDKQRNKEEIAAKERSKKKAARDKEFLISYSDDMAKKKLETIIYGIVTIVAPLLLAVVEAIWPNLVGDAVWYDIAKYVATISAAVATFTSIIDIHQNKKSFKKIATRNLPEEDFQDNEETCKKCLHTLKQTIVLIDFELDGLKKAKASISNEITNLGVNIKGLQKYIFEVEKQLEADKSERRKIGSALLGMAIDDCITGQHIAPQSQVPVDGQGYIYVPTNNGKH